MGDHGGKHNHALPPDFADMDRYTCVKHIYIYIYYTFVSVYE